MHPCLRGDERHQVEVGLGGCYLVVEELDDRLVQFAPSALQVQQALKEQAETMV